MFVVLQRLLLGVVSFIHPVAGSYGPGSHTALGLAAARRDAAKERAYRVWPSHCASVCGVIWAPQGPGADIASVHARSRNAGGGPGLSRDAFILRVLRELGVALCLGNASLGRSGLHGLACPSAEIVYRTVAVADLFGCVSRGSLLFVSGLGSSPFGAHAVTLLPCLSLKLTL
jgi:hypothetical protein